MQKIIDFNLLNNDGIIMLECGDNEQTVNFNEFSNIEEKKYGTVKVIYYIK